MSASKVLNLAEKQGLLEPKVIAELRQRVADSMFVVTPEAIAKVLVDHGHLTPFQARKLVASALGEPPPEPEPPKAPPPESPPAKRPKSAPLVPDELTLADDPTPSTHGRVVAPSAVPVVDDVVLLEAVEAAVPPPKPMFKPPPRGASKIPLAATIEEELVPLEPVPNQASSGPKKPWRHDAKSRPAAAVPDLTPLPPAPPAAPPLDDLLVDAFTQPGDPLANPASRGVPSAPVEKARKDVWDSPLLLVGGGVLGVLVVVFGLLYYSLTRGSAAELLIQADEQYKGGSYSTAIAAYEKFLEKYESDPNASFARVRLGMAQLHQVADAGTNPRQALKTAQTVLPQIEKEAKFSEARQELSAILPDLADGFATEAAGATQTAKKEELVKLADVAMGLVNNPAYLPASLRKDREPRIAAILDRLKLAQRSIQQDKDLAQALTEISAAEAQGDAALAYKVRADLLRVYPGLDAQDQLVAAIRKVGDKERELVQTSDQAVAAATDDPQPVNPRLVLSVRSGPEPAASPTRLVFVLVEGAVHGLDADSGRALWRRHVGYESLVQPQPLSRGSSADALVADARRHELLRLEGATGKVVWRQAIGQPFFAPALAGERIFVTTQAGRVLRIDAASGEVQRTAQLPQTATVAVAIDGKQSRDSNPPRLVQLGQHSTLFALSGDSLECSQTFYLGHRAGAILVPPVSVLDHIFAIESPADDHTLIHVLAPAGDKKQLAEIGRPFRLKGRVVMPLAVAGRRVTALTDLAQIAIYEVDPANRQEPVRLVAGLEPSERSPALGFYTADGNRLWLASRRCSMFEVQPALQNLNRKWSLYQDDAFIAPLQSLGNLLVHVRRHRGSPAVIVTGCDSQTGKTLWENELAVPLAGLLPVASRQTVDAITTQGRVFPIATGAGRWGIVDVPAFSLPQGSAGSVWPELTATADGVVAWTETQPGGRAFAYDAGVGSAPTAIALAGGNDAAAAAGVVWGKNLAVPLKSGKVVLLDIASGKPAAVPFLPTIKPEELPLWIRPVVLPDGSGLVIGEGRGRLYRLATKDQPQPHLHAAQEEPIELELHGGLAIAGDTVYGVGRAAGGDSIVAIDPQTLAVGSKWPLSGQAQFDPATVQGLVFVATEADGLFCLEAGQKVRWQRPLAHGPLAGPPVAGPTDELLLLFQSGMLSRISALTGEEVAALDVGEPLGQAACLVGQQVFVATSDGGVAIVALPSKP